MAGRRLGKPNSWRRKRRSEFCPQLLRVQSERLELSAPFGRRIAQSFDSNAAGQAAFNGGSDKIGREEGERDRHVDLPNAALFADAKLGDRCHSTRDHIIQPPTTLRDGVNQARPPLEPFRTDVASRSIMRKQDLAGSFGGRFLPGN